MPEGRSSNWISSLLGSEPKAGRQLIHVITAVLGSAAVLLFIAAIFDVMNTRYALFGSIACIVLSIFVTSNGSGFFTGDQEAVVTGSTKLQAALAMSPSPQKDRILIEAAQEAVEEGESAAALLALQAIQDPKVRDETAVKCALQIIENEGSEAALPALQVIQDPKVRDETAATCALRFVENEGSEAALLALQVIQDAQVRDETAAACALQIAENEGGESALPVARLIKGATCRNEVLQKLAEM